MILDLKGEKMPRKNYREEYTGISMPKKLMDIVEDKVNSSPFYASQAEYVRCAIKEKIERDEKPNLGEQNEKNY